ncbi:MAG: hypothetical protein NTV52_29885 [Acidobacteria bacterium]|nr:hypothetical protein [Acidobacteriota bacterium]
MAGINRGILDVVRRREVRFAGSEVDDVDPFTTHLVSIGGHLHRGGNRNRGHPIGHGEIVLVH